MTLTRDGSGIAVGQYLPLQRGDALAAPLYRRQPLLDLAHRTAHRLHVAPDEFGGLRVALLDLRRQLPGVKDDAVECYSERERVEPASGRHDLGRADAPGQEQTWQAVGLGHANIRDGLRRQPLGTADVRTALEQLCRQHSGGHRQLQRSLTE